MKAKARPAFRGQLAFVLGTTSALLAGLVFGACGGSSGTSDDDSDKGGGAEAGLGDSGGSSGTTGIGGSAARGGSSALGGSAGNGGTSGMGEGGAGPGQCLGAGQTCSDGLDCCTFSCVNGECSGDQCTADGQSCTLGAECCGGVCEGSICQPLNPGCRTSGNPCDGSGDCCSKYCVDGLCSPAPSYCRQTGDVCRTDFECCAGMCDIADGATLGTCRVAPASGAGECLSAGQVCSNGATYDPDTPQPICGGACCSRSCRPYGPTGVLICQNPSGCHPTGEICQEDLDCCGAEGRPNGDTAQVVCSKQGDNPIGRCTQGNACTPAGGICRLQDVQCNENANCCAGNTVVSDPPTCRQDNLGIPRCLAAGIDCAEPSNYVGQACASSADCCNLPCVPNPDGDDPPFVCGGECVPSGETCTTTADCCRGVACSIPPGSTRGTCGDTGTGGTGSGGTGGMGGTSTGGSATGGSAGACSSYGQACETADDCCNAVPCTNGFCVDGVR